jgi:hypothetical protein
MPEKRVTIRGMKYLALLLLAAVLAACDTSEEDRQFYYKGWVKPESAAQDRMYGGNNEGKLSVPSLR